MTLISVLKLLIGGVQALSFNKDDTLIGVFDTVLNKVAEDLLESRAVHVHLCKKTEI
jgi:hypothetical protein